MKRQKFNTVAIVGVGLIGGSIGLALRRRKLAREVVGIGRSTGSLRIARQVGAVDKTTTDLKRGVSKAELVVVCTPVKQIAQHVREAAAACPEGALITDAGSTKAQIVHDLDGSLGRGVRFVGSHPLAGGERSGAAQADAKLFVDRLVVLTPTDEAANGDVGTLRAFWTSLGARVIETSPEAHDEALAATSHLPHLLASTLASATPEELLDFTATGWADTTRIAAGDPELWTQIFLANRENLLNSLGRFESQLSVLKKAVQIKDRELLTTILTEAKRNRDAVGS
jgi:prephenate dehydrogenase